MEPEDQHAACLVPFGGGAAAAPASPARHAGTGCASGGLRSRRVKLSGGSGGVGSLIWVLAVLASRQHVPSQAITASFGHASIPRTTLQARSRVLYGAPTAMLNLRAGAGGEEPPRALRLRGGMDAAKQREYEVILDNLQRPDATPAQRQHAQQFALLLQAPVDFAELDPEQLAQAADASERKQLAIRTRLAQLQHLLDASASPTTQVVACNSLTALVTNHWDNTTLPHIEIRNYALSFLFAQASTPTAPSYVVRAMTRLLSRITRLGWLTCEGHRNVLQELNRFYDASVQHYVMGLQLMFDLVEELDVPALTRRELILKRQFLTMALLKIFKTAVDTLHKLQTQVRGGVAALDRAYTHTFIHMVHAYIHTYIKYIHTDDSGGAGCGEPDGRGAAAGRALPLVRLHRPRLHGALGAGGRGVGDGDAGGASELEGGALQPRAHGHALRHRVEIRRAAGAACAGAAAAAELGAAVLV